MDIFITVVIWIIGFYVGFALLLAIIFSALGADQSGNSELTIDSTVASVLLVSLRGTFLFR